MSEVYEWFKGTVPSDLLSVVLSKHLGRGTARDVYRSSINPDHVFKFELKNMSFQNAMEWEYWDAVKLTKWAKWFAPCVSISSCGTVLIQKYARNIETNELPIDIPAFFSDLKADNWGVIDGQPVCRDYGMSVIIDKTLHNKMKKADWN